ncbi:hypothetical protein GW17_00047655 [Ensete ventricosum]|nr:hypothetical protein GW17_00047655 [Ensete ventricosum]
MLPFIIIVVILTISSRTPGRYWHLFNDLGLTLPPLSLGVPAITPEAFQGLTNQAHAIVGMLQAIIPCIPQLTQRSGAQPKATPPTQAGAIPSPEGPPLATQLADDPPQIPTAFEHVPSGDATRHPTPAPSASTRSLPDPDTLSSDSTDSIRAQLPKHRGESSKMRQAGPLPQAAASGLQVQTHSQTTGIAHEERSSEHEECEVGYSPQAEEVQSGAPIGKRSHKERLSTVETCLDVLEAILEELYQGQVRLLGVESS